MEVPGNSRAARRLLIRALIPFAVSAILLSLPVLLHPLVGEAWGRGFDVFAAACLVGGGLAGCRGLLLLKS